MPKNSSKIMVFVVGHKYFDKPRCDIYRSIKVGNANAALLKFDFEDSDGDNITTKNKTFCELTAIYWIWRNVHDCSIIGLTHYRRYFFKKRFSKSLNDVVQSKWIDEQLRTHDIILPKKLYLRKYTIKQQYAAIHNLKDLEVCRRVLEERCPDYIESFEKVMNGRWLYPYNMFIMRRELFERYCQWLFDIMFELEKRIDVTTYDEYNRRVFGFISERLLTVWVLKNNLSVREAYVNNVEDGVYMKNIGKIVKRIILRND